MCVHVYMYNNTVLHTCIPTHTNTHVHVHGRTSEVLMSTDVVGH